MSVDVVLVSAPVMSVVRPSAALGLLQATLRAKDIRAESLYLNILFAEQIGIDLNEKLCSDLPSHLLVGDWLFDAGLGLRSQCPESGYFAELEMTLKKRGLHQLPDIKTENCSRFVSEAANAILKRKPRLVGFTTMFEQTAASLAIAAAVKKASSDTLICFGGANCHSTMGAVLIKHYQQIDYVFTGESDGIFAEFVARVLAGRAPPQVDGWLGRTTRGGASASPVLNLDLLPIPDYSDYFRQLQKLTDIARIRSCVPFETSRGCWWGQKHHCTFCGLNAEGMVFREKSAERVLTELDTLATTCPTHRFAATDNILSPRQLRSVFPALAAAPSSLRFFYELKSNIDEEKLRTLARAGVMWIQPGIESLSDAALRIMRKGVDSLLNLRLLRNCRELGVGAIWSFLHGFPGEQQSEYQAVARLIPLLEHLQPPCGCGRIRLDRFSPNFEQAQVMGFSSIEPTAAYGAIFQSVPAADLPDLAYFFEGASTSALPDDALDELKAAIAQWREQWIFNSESAPVLSATQILDRYLIKDTRRCAIESLYFATPVETAVLECFRSPHGVHAIGHLSDRWPVAALELALAALLFRGFVVNKEERFLSLIVLQGREVFSETDRADFPCGYVIASTEIVNQELAYDSGSSPLGR
jgi:ribosomal peptide maturation radical SAM protein 1